MTTYPTHWIEGKPAGSIKIYKNVTYKVVISPPGTKQKCNYFHFEKYGSQENALICAESWKYEM